MTMTRRDWLLGATLLAAGAGLSPPASAAVRVDATVGLLPKRLPERRWRIGYAESMPYGNYVGTFAGIVHELEAQSWLQGTSRMPTPKDMLDSQAMWAWLSAHDVGPYLQFVPDAWYGNLSQTTAEPILQRLERQPDLDLMIVMGTIAGQKLATDRHKVPTLVFSTTNAVAAKIVDSAEDSGHDHIWAHLDPMRFRRQLQIFHDAFHFKRLGIVYEDSSAGRAIASIDDVEAMAAHLKYEIVTRNVRAPASSSDFERYYADVLQAHQELSNAADAVFIAYGRWKLDRFAALVRPFQDRGIPTFSQLGPEEVSRGALMSVARSDFNGIGHFGCSIIARALNGEPLRRLPQIYFDTPTIAWNLAVAEKMNYHPPFTALLAADEIYTKLDMTN